MSFMCSNNSLLARSPGYPLAPPAPSPTLPTLPTHTGTPTTVIMAQYEFNVQMSCTGCSNAVNRVLARLDGVQSHNVDLEAQKVSVVSDTLSLQQVEETIAKTGKKIVSAEVK